MKDRLTITEADALLARLTRFNSASHFTEFFYPLLAEQVAGKTLSRHELVTAYLSVLLEYELLLVDQGNDPRDPACVPHHAWMFMALVRNDRDAVELAAALREALGQQSHQEQPAPSDVHPS